MTLTGPQPRLTAVTPSGLAVGLRPPEARDLDAIIEACQDTESVRWTTVPHPYARSDAEFFVTEHAPGRWRRGEGAVFAITDPEDAYAGSMELRVDGAGTGDVGYLVAPWARGRGTASTALRTLCLWGFSTFGLNRIEWKAYVGNDASRRVAEKAGFTIEGVLPSGCVQRGVARDAWTGTMLPGGAR
jgi:RimJ/RimL family protein N-acetyltransferase